MPELPDVEHFRRVFDQHATGRTIHRVITTDPAIVRNATPEELDDALRGQRFEEPARHGKWMVAWTTGPAVLLHFGMTGDIVPAPDDTGRHRHDRTIFELDRGEIRYRNMRKLGGVWLARGREEAEALLQPLGPDALTMGRREFLGRLRRHRGAIKPILMDQHVLSGVGNLVADEVLWHARLHPTRRVADLTDDELAALHRTLRRVLGTWVDRHRLEPRGWLIHARAVGGACPRCGTPLERSVVGGRTTFHCPQCQPT